VVVRRWVVVFFGVVTVGVCALVVVLSGSADVGGVVVVTGDSVVDGTGVVVGGTAWPLPEVARKGRNGSTWCEADRLVQP
jgi:hypothetical protein